VLVLFDHGTPKGLARLLTEHTVHMAQSRDWDSLSNGDLLNAAEQAGFDVRVGNHGRWQLSGTFRSDVAQS
jgi:hypothetical protein